MIKAARAENKAAKHRDFPHLFSSNSQTSQYIMKEFEKKNVLKQSNNKTHR